MSDRQATCEERIAEQMEGRLADIRDLTTLAQTHNGDEDEIPSIERQQELAIEFDSQEQAMRDEIAEQAQERLYEYPLGITRRRLVKIELSWGGPADFIKLEVDEDNDVVAGTYHFQDWFDGAVRPLTGDDLEAVEQFAEGLGVLHDV